MDEQTRIHLKTPASNGSLFRAAGDQRVLAIAYEPWEAYKCLGILRAGLELGEISSAYLWVVDGFHVYTRDLLNHLRTECELIGVTLHSLEGLFARWQTLPRGENSMEDTSDEDVARLIAQLNPARDPRQILATCHVRSSWERAPYHTPLDSNQLDAIARDVLASCEAMVLESQPDLVLCIHNNYLVKSLAYEVCRHRRIPHFTLTHSRISDLWLWSSEFALGSQGLSGMFHRIAPSDNEPEAGETGKVTGLVPPGRPLYQGPTVSAAQGLLDARRHPWVATARSTRDSSKSALTVVSKQLRHLRSMRSPRYHSSWWRVGLYHFARASRRVNFAFRGIPFSLASMPEENHRYIFMPLHLRPESSILVNGFGVDELDFVRTLSEHFGDRYLLFVKENPGMVGDRRRKFYKEIAAVPSVRLVDPTVPSTQLIEGACAVASLSGTALLEGALLGKPAITIGEPEFLAWLTPFEDRDAFVEEPERIAARARDYVTQVFEYGIPFSEAGSYDSSDKMSAIERYRRRFDHASSQALWSALVWATGDA